MKRLRIVGLVGLLSLTLFAIPAAPSSARLVCPKGQHKKIYCKRKITIKIKIKITATTIKITITVKDPHATVLLLHNGHVIRHLFNGNVSGTFHVNSPKPTKAGVYTVKVIATAGGVTKVATKSFRVTLSSPATTGVGFTG